MAKDRSNTSRFPSRSNGGWVTPAQYLTECLCVLIAKQQKKNIGDNFWQKEPWTGIFRRQVPMANKLLKQHSADIILSVMRDRRCWKMRSFGANWLIRPLLAEKQREHDAAMAQQTETKMVKTSTTQKPQRIRLGKKSLFASLKEAENGKEKA